MTVPPETRFTQSGEISIACQVLGSGPIDLVLVPGFLSHLEENWQDPDLARFLEHFASFSRLIMFDKRGTGLSDRSVGIATLEQRMDDVRAVMDAVGSRSAALLGISEGGPMCVLFAATHPERTRALILYGSIARGTWAPDYPWAARSAEMDSWFEEIRREWGGPVNVEDWAPSLSQNEHFRQWWWAKYLRLAGSPSAAINAFKMNKEIDVRDILPTIHVPTLVLRRTGDRAVPVEHSRYLGSHIPGCRFVEIPGQDHPWWVGDFAPIVSEIQDFLTGERNVFEPDRVLATILFTDIVDSTLRATEMGDRKWRELPGSHNALMEGQIQRFRGRPVKNTGDGFLATFDGPARAIRCALTISREIEHLGIQIRAGCTPGRSSSWGATSGAFPSTWPPVSCPRPRPGRCGFPGP
jgi:pimeloyl-ACP methyl ester carboxylesterase